MSRIIVKRQILQLLADSPEPMSCMELVAATQISTNGVYILVGQLYGDGKLSRRRRAQETRARPIWEYSLVSADDQPKLEDFEDEIPDDVWWAEQQRAGFRKPKIYSPPTVVRV
jgi:predicted ArsR family transcriptional regulator